VLTFRQGDAIIKIYQRKGIDKMLGYKNRSVRTQKSKVYYNLHKHLFSVQQEGLVVLHTEALKLVNVHFQVSEAGRQRVLAEGRKNVHAYVNGVFQGEYAGEPLEGFREAYYNPHKVDSFVDKETLEPLYEADTVYLIDRRIFYK